MGWKGNNTSLLGLFLMTMLAVLPLGAQPVGNGTGDEHAPSGWVSEEAWEKLAKDLEYDRTFDEENTETDKPAESSGKKRTSKSVSGFGILQWIAFGLIIAVLVFVLIRVLAPSLLKRNRLIKRRVSLENIEDDLETAEINPLLSQALADGNYRLAIRLLYLQVLQELNRTGAISWKRDKTNGEYVRELRTHHHHATFIKITRDYERIWYGEYPVDQSQYHQLFPSFNQLLNPTGR